MLRRRDVRRKELAIEYDADGGTRTRTLSQEEALRPTLDEREVMAVAELGLRIEEHYGSPQDTEWRGALRYTREPDVFALELEAVRRVWDAGLHNLHVMLPFVRSTRELRRCRELIAESSLLDRPGFELWVMAEVPSVLFNLTEYAKLGVTGISIGSNDLTQLLLGADRDNELLAETFDERDPAVTAYLRELIPRARELGLRTSICGQAPSVHPSTPSCWCAPGATRSQSASMRSTEPEGWWRQRSSAYCSTPPAPAESESMTVWVVFASKYGSTREVAEAIAEGA